MNVYPVVFEPPDRWDEGPIQSVVIAAHKDEARSIARASYLTKPSVERVDLLGPYTGPDGEPVVCEEYQSH